MKFEPESSNASTQSREAVIGILGYGSRPPSADALIKIARLPSVRKLSIFWNAPSAEVSHLLAELQSRASNISVHLNPENLGSAGGYIKLIENFRDNETADHLLLLDDDLELEADCIKILFKAAESYPGKLDNTLLLAYRPGLPELADLVTKKIAIRRPRPGCCIGFHFLNILKAECEPIDYDAETRRFFIGSAPWGGLLIPRQALKKLGLPREDFFLYAEDYELTSRFVWNGGKIVLVPDALITDKDTAWNAVGGNTSNIRRRMLLLPDIKVFHETRNRNFMARKYYAGSFPIYLINKYIFLAYAYFLGILYGRLSRARLIHRAINDGERMASSEPVSDIFPSK